MTYSIRAIIVLGLCFGLTTAYAFRPITSKSMPEKAKSMAGVYPEYPEVAYGTGPKAQIIKRGEYLAKVGDCIACHSDPANGGKPFAGGLGIDTGFGRVYAPNITPDKASGIGGWGAEDFYRAMHHGISPQGSYYYPAFPYVYFSQLTRQDINAMWAYFQAIPAVKQENKAHDLYFPFNIRSAQILWRAAFFYPQQKNLEYIPHRSKAWNRGNYLVNGAGHCSMCHTPMNLFGAEKSDYFLTGSFIEGYWAPNITYDGLSHATSQALMKVFREDTLLKGAGNITGPMKQVNHDSLQHLTDSDIVAIATYLHSVKTSRPYYVRPKHVVSLERGQHVYVNACAACHQNGKLGALKLGDANAWFKLAKEKGRAKLYRHTIDGFNQMPQRGNCVECSDDDIESAVNYILYESLTKEQVKELKRPQKRPKPTLADGKEIYESQCSACHQTGQLGAPVLGDKDAWRRIINKNMDVLIRNKLQGSYRYPPKGGCKYCTTPEVIAAIKYMVNESRSKGDYSLW